MLQRFLEREEVIRRLADEESPKLKSLLPSRDKMEHVRSVMLVLKPISKMSKLAEGEKYITSAHIPKWLSRLFQYLSKPHTNVLDEHRRVVQESLEKRLGHLLTKPNVCLLAASLHPRYSKLEFISSELRDLLWEHIVEECLIYVPDHSNDKMQSRKVVEGLVSMLRGVLCNLTAEEEVLDPLLFYPSRPHFSWLFPFIKQILSVPATSAPSERLFKGPKRAVTKDRNRLAFDRVEYLSVIRNYINQCRDDCKFDEEDFFDKVTSYMEEMAKDVAILDENLNLVLDAQEGEEESA